VYAVDKAVQNFWANKEIIPHSFVIPLQHLGSWKLAVLLLVIFIRFVQVKVNASLLPAESALDSVVATDARKIDLTEILQLIVVINDQLSQNQTCL
jgi:hypothetical protein